MKKVVILGGGTGLSTILRGLKYFPLDITAVVTVCDDGKSTGILREEFDIPAVGDLRNVLVSLSEVEPLVEDLLQYRFNTSSDLNNHAVGNLLLTALFNITGNLTSAIEALGKVLNIKGRVLPLTEDKPVLVAHTKDNDIIIGESNITKAKKEIDYIEYKDKITVIPQVINAIYDADLIIFGIGSLYTSIIANILSDDIKEALINSKAKKMHISNVMTQTGETDNYKVSDCINAINKHIGKNIIDVVISNSKYIDIDIQNKYNELEKSTPILLDIEEINKMKIEVIAEELSIIVNGQVRHDPLKTALSVFAYIMRF